MKKLLSSCLLGLTIIALTSCSSSSKKSDDAKDLNGINDEFDWIDNNDFIKVKEVRYRPQDDKFKAPISNYGSLSKETAARVPVQKLKEVEGLSDKIGVLISRCYRGQFNNAFKLADEIYQAYKKNSSYWNQIGTCFYLQGEYRKALLYYNKSREVGGQYAPPVNNIGVLYLKKGQDQMALEAFKKARSIDRNKRTPQYNLAQLYLKYGQLNKAKKIFVSLYKINSADIDIRYALANIYLLEGKLSQSFKMFNSLNGSYKSKPEFKLNYAVLLSLMGRRNESLRSYKGIIVEQLGSLRPYYEEVGQYLRSN